MIASLRVGIIGNKDRKEARETIERLLGFLRTCGVPVQCYLAPQLAELVPSAHDCEIQQSLYDVAAKSEVVIAMGGDGTMLGAARAILRANPTVALLGVNLGKLGFIAENQPEILQELIDDLIHERLLKEERLVLQAEVASERQPAQGTQTKRDDQEPGQEGKRRDKISMNALNEIVIDNFGSTRMLTFEISVNGALVGALRADGLIVATPTGSTGYAVSAGGPIIEPTSTVLLITPIAPHSLNVRPIIVPEDSVVRVRASSDETKQALVVADGQEEVVVDTAAIVTVTQADHRIKLLRRKDQSYFDLLRSKLLWSLDPRDSNYLRR